MEKINIQKGVWAEGISDGLTIPCGRCKNHTDFDYTITDELWKEIVPQHLKLGVICLSCLDTMATEKGIDISNFLERVQFTGTKKTIELIPKRVFYYT